MYVKSAINDNKDIVDNNRISYFSQNFGNINGKNASDSKTNIIGLISAKVENNIIYKLDYYLYNIFYIRLF